MERAFQLEPQLRGLLGRDEGKAEPEDRHESTKAYLDYMRLRCGELHRVLKRTGSFLTLVRGQHFDPRPRHDRLTLRNDDLGRVANSGTIYTAGNKNPAVL